jgi:hypothetical protein
VAKVGAVDQGWPVKDILVIMGSSTGEWRGTMKLYLSQLVAAGIAFHVEPLAAVDSTIASKLRYVRKMAQRFAEYDTLIFTDAFDVQFFGHAEHLAWKTPWKGVLLAAERNCHPPECKALNIPDVGPWRYANGGGMAGDPQSFLEWCDEIEKHPLYRPEKIDQQFLNELVAEGSPLARIDSKTMVFFCLYGGYEELDFANGKPINMKYATWPHFIHANGGWSTEALEEKRRKRAL